MQQSNFKLLLILLFISTFSSCVVSSYDDPCIISGKVTDSAGKGLPEVLISLKSKLFEDSLKTDAKGNYKINLSEAGIVELVFLKTGYSSKSSNLVLLGGEKKKYDVIMNTLSEDAYFNVEIKEKTVFNTGEIFSIGIHTNVLYELELESKASWISCTKSGSFLNIKCDSNETTDERIALIILKPEGKPNDTITIQQLAGPVLRVIDYTGLKTTSFPQTKPFVTFSREISVVSASSSNQNLQYELSDDKKTINFSNIKFSAFSPMPIKLTVKDSDGIQLSFELDLKLFINTQSLPSHNGQKYIFTNDDKYIWVYTANGYSYTLRRFSSADFKEETPITLTQSANIFYNPYNNSLYVTTYRSFEDRQVSDISIYNAETSAFISKLTIDLNYNTISDMAFSASGYGIMILGNELYYIDSANEHKCGLFSTLSMLYDQHEKSRLIPSHIDMCNNNKTFILYGVDISGATSVYSYNPENRVLRLVFNNGENYEVVTNNFVDVAYCFNENSTKIICMNVVNFKAKILNLPSTGVRNLAVLKADGTDPNILTSNFSLISVDDNSIKNFTHQGDSYYIKSSNDGKLVVLNYKGTIYLYQSEIFTKYYNYIK